MLALRPEGGGVGVVRAVWHLPLFWMPGTAEAALPLLPFVAGTVTLPMVFAWLAVMSIFSVLPAILPRGAINAGFVCFSSRHKAAICNPVFRSPASL